MAMFLVIKNKVNYMKLFTPAAKPGRETFEIEPSTLHQIKAIIEKNKGNLSLDQLQGEELSYELADILQKHGNVNNWLKSVEGENIEIHFFGNSWDKAKSYFYHVSGGEIKRGTFGGCLTEATCHRKYTKADGTTFKVVHKYGTPRDVYPELEEAEEKHAATP